MLLSLFNIEIYGTSIKIVVGAFYVARFLSQKKVEIGESDRSIKRMRAETPKKFLQKNARLNGRVNDKGGAAEKRI